jgi:L-iditol 2-dehydrogenase
LEPNVKALVKFAPGEGNLDVIDVDEPRCGDDQVKIEIAFCGVCGTDLHILHDTFRNYPPVILGHECSGIVAEVGCNVADVGVGERVTVLGATAVTCGTCRYCRSGYFIFCRNRRGIGHGVNGAFTRFLVARPDQLYRIPDHFTLEEAALSEPFAAAVQAVTEITKAQRGETAIVSGPGPIGLLCLKLLVAEGVRTLVAGAADDDESLEAAMQVGAADVVNVGTRNLGDAVSEFTDAEGVDIALECAGHPSSVRGCLESLRPMGRYTQVAICGREIPFPMDQIFYKQLTIRGSITYTARTWQRMMDIYAAGAVRLKDLVTETLPISEWREAFHLCASRRAIKVLMYPIG